MPLNNNGVKIMFLFDEKIVATGMHFMISYYVPVKSAVLGIFCYYKLYSRDFANSMTISNV